MRTQGHSSLRRILLRAVAPRLGRRPSWHELRRVALSLPMGLVLLLTLAAPAPVQGAQIVGHTTSAGAGSSVWQGSVINSCTDRGSRSTASWTLNAGTVNSVDEGHRWIATPNSGGASYTSPTKNPVNGAASSGSFTTTTDITPTTAPATGTISGTWIWQHYYNFAGSTFTVGGGGVSSTASPTSLGIDGNAPKAPTISNQTVSNISATTGLATLGYTGSVTGDGCATSSTGSFSWGPNTYSAQGTSGACAQSVSKSISVTDDFGRVGSPTTATWTWNGVCTITVTVNPYNANWRVGGVTVAATTLSSLSGAPAGTSLELNNGSGWSTSATESHVGANSGQKAYTCRGTNAPAEYTYKINGTTVTSWSCPWTLGAYTISSIGASGSPSSWTYNGSSQGPGLSGGASTYCYANNSLREGSTYIASGLFTMGGTTSAPDSNYGQTRTATCSINSSSTYVANKDYTGAGLSATANFSWSIAQATQPDPTASLGGGTLAYGINGLQNTPTVSISTSGGSGAWSWDASNPTATACTKTILTTTTARLTFPSGSPNNACSVRGSRPGDGNWLTWGPANVTVGNVLKGSQLIPSVTVDTLVYGIDGATLATRRTAGASGPRGILSFSSPNFDGGGGAVTVTPDASNITIRSNTARLANSLCSASTSNGTSAVSYLPGSPELPDGQGGVCRILLSRAGDTNWSAVSPAQVTIADGAGATVITKGSRLPVLGADSLLYGIVGKRLNDIVSGNPLRSISKASQSGATVTLTTTESHGLSVGQNVTVAGIAGCGASWNGTYLVLAAASNRSLTYTTATADDCAGTGSKNIAEATGQNVNNSYKIQLKVVGHGFVTGDQITISKLTNEATTPPSIYCSPQGQTSTKYYLNGTFTITRVDSDNFTYTLAGPCSQTTLTVSGAKAQKIALPTVTGSTVQSTTPPPNGVLIAGNVPCTTALLPCGLGEGSVSTLTYPGGSSSDACETIDGRLAINTVGVACAINVSIADDANWAAYAGEASVVGHNGPLGNEPYTATTQKGTPGYLSATGIDPDAYGDLTTGQSGSCPGLDCSLIYGTDGTRGSYKVLFAGGSAGPSGLDDPELALIGTGNSSTSKLFGFDASTEGFAATTSLAATDSAYVGTSSARLEASGVSFVGTASATLGVSTVSFVGSVGAPGSATASTTLASPTVPPARATGDLVLYGVTVRTAQTANPTISGYTFIKSSKQAGLETYLYYRVATGSDNAATTFGTSTTSTGSMIVLRGVDTSTTALAAMISGAVGSTNASSTSVGAGAALPGGLAIGGAVLWFGSSQIGTTTTATLTAPASPVAFTLGTVGRTASAASSNSAWAYALDKTAATGLVAPIAGTVSIANINNGLALALAPAYSTTLATPTVPTHASGDLVLYGVTVRTAQIANPTVAGYTFIKSSKQTGLETYLYYRVATGATTTENAVATFDTGTHSTASMVILSGVDTSPTALGVMTGGAVGSTNASSTIVSAGAALPGGLSTGGAALWFGSSVIGTTTSATLTAPASPVAFTLGAVGRSASTTSSNSAWAYALGATAAGGLVAPISGGVTVANTNNALALAVVPVFSFAAAATSVVGSASSSAISAVSVIGSIGANGSATASTALATPVVPATRAVGDLILYGVSVRTAQIANPTVAGYTFIKSSKQTGLETYLYYRVATGTTADNAATTFGTSTTSTGSMIVLRGVDTSTAAVAAMVSGAVGSANASGTVVSAGAALPGGLARNGAVLWFGSSQIGTTTTASLSAPATPVAFTLGTVGRNANAASSNSAWAYALDATSATGLVAPIAGTVSIANINNGLALALAPAYPTSLATPVVPATRAVGDLILYGVSVRTAQIANPTISGYTFIKSSKQTGLETYLYYRVATGTTADNAAATFDTGTTSTGSMIVLRGVDTRAAALAAMVSGAVGSANASSTSVSAGAALPGGLTPSGAVLWFGSSGIDATTTTALSAPASPIAFTLGTVGRAANVASSNSAWAYALGATAASGLVAPITGAVSLPNINNALALALAPLPLTVSAVAHSTNDLAVLAVTLGTAQVASPVVSGYTLFKSVKQSGLETYLYYRVATGAGATEDAGIVIDTASSASATLTLLHGVEISGVGTDLAAATGGANSAASTSVAVGTTMPPLYTQGLALWIGSLSLARGSTITLSGPPTGFTTGGNSGAGANTASVQTNAAYRLAPPSLTAPLAGTASGSVTSNAIAVTLRQALPVSDWNATNLALGSTSNSYSQAGTTTVVWSWGGTWADLGVPSGSTISNVQMTKAISSVTGSFTSASPAVWGLYNSSGVLLTTLASRAAPISTADGSSVSFSGGSIALTGQSALSTIEIRATSTITAASGASWKILHDAPSITMGLTSVPSACDVSQIVPGTESDTDSTLAIATPNQISGADCLLDVTPQSDDYWQAGTKFTVTLGKVEKGRLNTVVQEGDVRTNCGSTALPVSTPKLLCNATWGSTGVLEVVAAAAPYTGAGIQLSAAPDPSNSVTACSVGSGVVANTTLVDPGANRRAFYLVTGNSTTNPTGTYCAIVAKWLGNTLWNDGTFNAFAIPVFTVGSLPQDPLCISLDGGSCRYADEEINLPFGGEPGTVRHSIALSGGNGAGALSLANTVATNNAVCWINQESGNATYSLQFNGAGICTFDGKREAAGTYGSRSETFYLTVVQDPQTPPVSWVSGQLIAGATTVIRLQGGQGDGAFLTPIFSGPSCPQTELGLSRIEIVSSTGSLLPPTPYAEFTVATPAGSAGDSCTMRIERAGTSRYEASTDDVSMPINKLASSASITTVSAQTTTSDPVTVTVQITGTTGDLSIDAPTGSNAICRPSGPITRTIDADPRVNSASFAISFPGSGGTCSLTVTVADDASYDAVSASATFAVVKTVQTLTLSDPGDRTLSDPRTFTLTASADSGLTPTLASSSPSVCTVAASPTDGEAPGPFTYTVTTAGVAGTCTLTADQSGNATYSGADQVSTSFSISQPVPGAPDLTPASDTGAFDFDNVTNENTLVIEGDINVAAGLGSLSASSLRVTIQADLQCGAGFDTPAQSCAGGQPRSFASTVTPLRATNSTGPEWSRNFADLPEGIYLVKAQTRTYSNGAIVTAAAFADSPWSPALRLIVDRTAPRPSVPATATSATSDPVELRTFLDGFPQVFYDPSAHKNESGTPGSMSISFSGDDESSAVDRLYVGTGGLGSLFNVPGGGYVDPTDAGVYAPIADFRTKIFSLPLGFGYATEGSYLEVTARDLAGNRCEDDPYTLNTNEASDCTLRLTITPDEAGPLASFKNGGNESFGPTVTVYRSILSYLLRLTLIDQGSTIGPVPLD